MSKPKSKNYEVGYGKPPKERRFKPGLSGNPRGRPKKCSTLIELFAGELKRKRTIVEDGQRLRTRTDEILVKRLLDVALKGNLKALGMMIELVEQVRENESAKIECDVDAMTIEELSDEYARLRAMPFEVHPRLKKKL